MIIQCVLFIFVLLFAFVCPGYLFLPKKPQQPIETAFLYSLFIGIVLFTTVGLAGGFLGMRFLPIVYLIISIGVFGVRKMYIHIPHFYFSRERAVIWLTLFVLAGVFSLPMLGSGWNTREGLTFYSVNGSDGLWHISLIHELANTFPPQHPGFSGIPLTGYHFFYDFLLGEVHRLFYIDALHLLFHFFPLVIAMLWVSGTFLIASRFFRSQVAGIIAAFLSTLGGSFAFIIPYLLHQKASIDDGFGILQPFTAQVNPQFASSALFVIFSCLFLYEYFRQKDIRWLAILILIAGVSVGFKVYAGMIILGGLVVVTAWSLVFRKHREIIPATSFAVLLGYLFFHPFNKSYGFLLYQPLWPPHRVMQGALDFTQWEIKRQTLSSMGSIKGLIRLEVEAFLIFLFGNVGTRIVGFMALFGFVLKGLWERSLLHIYFLSLLAISFLVPLFFIQPTGGPFNMIQMYWYFLLLFSILAAGGIWMIMRMFPKIIAYGTLLLFILFTLPSVSEKIQHFLRPPSHLPAAYAEALVQLSRVGSYANTTLEIPTLSVYDYSALDQWFGSVSDPTIPSIGKKRAFINEETVTFPYEEKERRLKMIEAFMRGDVAAARNILNQAEISYIIAPAKQPWIEKVDGVKKIFSNEDFYVYEVLPL